MTIVTRKEAKECGLTRYFTGEACKWGYIAERLVVSYSCTVCHYTLTKRQRSLGGKQHHNRLVSNGRWQKSDGAASQNYRLARGLRGRLRVALHGGYKSGSAVRDLGCTIPQFREYIVAKFTDEMSWDNHGVDGWHLDHIRPLSSFDLNNHGQFLAACHYTNYQPLWATENQAKGARYAA